jgi:hypothetical protein
VAFEASGAVGFEWLESGRGVISLAGFVVAAGLAGLVEAACCAQPATANVINATAAIPRTL